MFESSNLSLEILSTETGRMNSYQTTGTGTWKHVKSAFKDMSLSFVTEQRLYNFSGLGVRVVWKLLTVTFELLRAHVPSNRGNDTLCLASLYTCQPHLDSIFPDWSNVPRVSLSGKKHRTICKHCLASLALETLRGIPFKQATPPNCVSLRHTAAHRCQLVRTASISNDSCQHRPLMVAWSRPLRLNSGK